MSRQPESVYPQPSPEQIRQVIKAAHVERARAVRRLLGALFQANRREEHVEPHIATLAHAGRS